MYTHAGSAHAVEDQLDLRLQRAAGRLRGERGDVGQPVQVLPLGLVEPQGAGDRVQDLDADVDGPPCSSHVYQVTPTPASCASSSRRSPGVRRRKPGGRPTSAGLILARRDRRNAASSARDVVTVTPAILVPHRRGCQVVLIPG